MVSIIYSTYSTETRGQRVRSAYRRVQTRRQYTESTQRRLATRIGRRAAHAAHATTVAPDDRARAAKPCNARATHVVEVPQPATHGHARRGPRRSAIDGRPPRASAREPCHLCARERRLRGRARSLTHRAQPTRPPRPCRTQGARSPRPDATNERRTPTGERHGSIQNATGVAGRGSRRRSGGLTHAHNLSSVPELLLDSNLRPSDSLDTCWGRHLEVGVGRQFSEG